MSWQGAYFKKCQEVQDLQAKLQRLQELAREALMALDKYDLARDEGALAAAVNYLEEINGAD